jgi:multicomponent Na+:H+ antiporter subunit E
MALIKKYWLTITVSIVFWCILNENFYLITIVVGIFVSLIATTLVSFLFTDRKSSKGTYRLPPWHLIKYIWVLFINIFKSAMTIIKIIIHEEDHPIIVKISTKVLRDWPICLIANGITLTPGTVTIDVTENELTVLWLNPTTNDSHVAAKIIQSHFEQALMSKEERLC